MKRFQCLMVTTLTLRASIDTMFCDLADALRRAGVHTRMLIDVPQAPNLPLAHGLVGDLRDYDGPRFLIDTNAKSHFNVQTADGRPLSIHDAWNIPRVTIFESNPIHHVSHLAQSPQNAVFTVVDASHLRFFDAFAITARAIDFLPHAGPPPLQDILPAADRPIDVLFIGNIKHEPPLAAWLDGQPCAPELKPALRHAIEQRWESQGDIGASLASALAAEGIAPEPRRDLTIACAAEGYVNNVKRLELLQSIRAGRVVVCGEVEATLPEAAPVTATGPTGFVKCLQLMDNAKLLLNVMPFRSGAHERVFYGLSRGAYVVSDYSTLLDLPAADGAGISFLPREPDLLDDVIADVLSSRIDERVAAGRAWYAERHTWDHRARQILALLGPLF
ncbi:MAG TPA: glycosyltransferase [Stellaceae bacterium]|nr:glycosyltransferase [Stellaceae bacterium]